MTDTLDTTHDTRTGILGTGIQEGLLLKPVTYPWAMELYDQAVAVVAVIGYGFVVTLLIAFAVDKTMGLRLTEESEATGIDLDQHAESAYDLEGVVHAPGTKPTPQAVIASAERLVASSATEGRPTT